MPSLEPILIYSRKLDALGLRYMIAGGVAAIYYGEPRLTNGVDIVLFLERDDADRIVRMFPSDEFYCPPIEVIQIEAARPQRGHFNIIHHGTGFNADIYTAGRDALHAWGITHGRNVTIGDDRITLAPPEYVIIRKLQFYREGGSPKHLRDIVGMLSGLGADWSRESLLRLIESHGLANEWQTALDSSC